MAEEEEEEAIVPSSMWLFCSAIIVRYSFKSMEYINGYKKKMFVFLHHVFPCHVVINIYHPWKSY